MRFTRLIVVLAAALSLAAVGAGSASAATVEKCQAQLDALRVHTLGAQASFANERDVTRLVDKLAAASTKLDGGKNADAVQKLVDFQNSLNAIASTPKAKLDPAVAQSLSAEAQGVISCINAVGTA